MNKLITFSVLAASALSLAACNNNKATQEAAAANEAAAAKPTDLPPVVVASRIYRCKDNSVVAVDFLSKTAQLADSTMANIHIGGNTGPTAQLTKADPEGRYEAEGYSVSDSGKSVTIEVPGKNAQLCKA